MNNENKKNGRVSQSGGVELSTGAVRLGRI